MKKKIISMVAVVVSMVMLFTMPCNAAHTNKGGYTDVAKVANTKIKTDRGTMNFTSMQGMAVGSRYVYTAKLPVVNNEVVEDYACIVRTDTRTGNQDILTCYGDEYVKRTGHANDMCVTSINNQSTLFVSATDTANTKEVNLLRMPVSGTTIKTNGYFKVRYNNKPLALTGITILEHPSKANDGKITFLFKSKNPTNKKIDDVFIGSVNAYVGSGTIYAKRILTLNKDNVLINGKAENFSGYANQGFSYYDNKLYLALSGQGKEQNKSIMLVYNNINNYTDNHSTVTRISPDNNISFKITSSTYSNLFEIESCGICTDGNDLKLYFNTNRRKTSKSSNWDGIHYINGYKAK